jgi:translation initiation factor IF-3
MAPEVRLSGPDNEPLGIVSLAEALRMAGEIDVDLVEIAATAVPPVCRLMDYGKFKYQEQKKAAEAKSKQKVIEVKEIKFRPGTDDGDYNIKMRNIKRFLDDGDKCKITLRFRGREITHQEIGMALLQRIRDELADLIVVEQFPKLEGTPDGHDDRAWQKKTGWHRQTRGRSYFGSGCLNLATRPASRV